jgi:hypothetical protein
VAPLGTSQSLRRRGTELALSHVVAPQQLSNWYIDQSYEAIGRSHTPLCSLGSGCSAFARTWRTRTTSGSMPLARRSAPISNFRVQPCRRLCQGVPVIFRRPNTVHLLDAAYRDHRATSRPPTTRSSVTPVAGYCKEWLVPEELARLKNKSPIGRTWLDLVQRAVALLFGRAHIVPGEATMAP